MHQERISHVSEKCHVTALLLHKVYHIFTLLLHKVYCVITLASFKMQTLATSDKHFLSDELSNMHLKWVLNKLRALDTIRVNKLHKNSVYHD